MSRIIAGSRGGRRLTMPPGDRTRPTTDRVREALFSALTSWNDGGSAEAAESLAGLAFLDLFAGSGAVGLEAASRGAGPVLLVEADRRTALVTRRNAADLQLSVQVRTDRVEQVAASAAPQPFDLVYADPPYELATGALEAVVADLLRHGWAVQESLVVLERSRRTPDPTWPDGIRDAWSRSYGETVLHFGPVRAR
ncbi:MAG: putative methyltransferase [Friedmanniella sp.]|nr:putative methyltransferase [Friedmanniella sp.]